MVSFSHDPCERPLHLITQMPGSRNAAAPWLQHGAMNGGSNGHINDGSGIQPLPITTSPRRGQRLMVDAEGWQTVMKRK